MHAGATQADAAGARIRGWRSRRIRADAAGGYEADTAGRYEADAAGGYEPDLLGFTRASQPNFGTKISFQNRWKRSMQLRVDDQACQSAKSVPLRLGPHLSIPDSGLPDRIRLACTWDRGTLDCLAVCHGKRWYPYVASVIYAEDTLWGRVFQRPVFASWSIHNRQWTCQVMPSSTTFNWRLTTACT